MAPNIAFVDIFHLFTNFTVDALVARKAEARVAADSVFAASIVYTRNGLACITVWGKKQNKNDILIKYLLLQLFLDVSSLKTLTNIFDPEIIL